VGAVAAVIAALAADAPVSPGALRSCPPKVQTTELRASRFLLLLQLLSVHICALHLENSIT